MALVTALAQVSSAVRESLCALNLVFTPSFWFVFVKTWNGANRLGLNLVHFAMKISRTAGFALREVVLTAYAVIVPQLRESQNRRLLARCVQVLMLMAGATAITLYFVVPLYMLWLSAEGFCAIGGFALARSLDCLEYILNCWGPPELKSDV